MNYSLFANLKTLINLSTTFILVVVPILLIIAGDIHINPGPPNRFKFASWNLDSLLARSKCKLNYIKAIDTVHNFDLFGVCETYLTPNVDDDQLYISGFSPSPIRSDCIDLDGKAKGGVCLYYKEHIPIKSRPDLVELEETVVAEIRVKHNRKVFVVLTYRSPSKSSKDELEHFCSSLSSMIDKIKNENPLTIIVTGDFNGRSPTF